MYVKRLVRSAHFKIEFGHSRSFKVILIGVSRKTEWIFIVMHKNVNIICETYEDIESGRLQLCRFQPPNFGLTTVISETLSKN